MNILIPSQSVLVQDRDLLQYLKLKNRLFALTQASSPIDIGIFEATLEVHDWQTIFPTLLQGYQLHPAETFFFGHSIEALLAAKKALLPCGIFIPPETNAESIKTLQSMTPDESFTSKKEIIAFFDRLNFSESRLWPIPTVGALIFNPQNQVLLVRTTKWSGLYGIPGGKIHYGESAEAALHREILEETGLTLKNIRFIMNQDCIEHPQFYKPRHFILLNYSAEVEDPEIKVQLNYESNAYIWVDFDKVNEYAVNEPTGVLLQKVKELQGK